MKSRHIPYGPYERFFKRPLDLICGVAAIIAFWWLYLIIAILVKIKLGSPVLFIQERPGKDEKIFKLYKFRTMTDERGPDGELLPDERRLTKFGKVLRSTSLDELPEAINLINGTLSVCGPRPLLVEYLPYYSEAERHRHDVRPGLSGLAQVHGRNAVTWEQKFFWDLKYVNQISFWQDLRIIFATIYKAAKQSDVVLNAEGNLMKIRQQKINLEDAKKI